jgi:hypothetical protein
MPARPPRVTISVCLALLLIGTSVQAAPGAPGQPQSISGTLEIVHADDFEDVGSHQHAPGEEHLLPDLTYWLNTDAGEQLLLEFEGTPPEATTGESVTVTGERKDKSFKVKEMKRNEAAAGGNGGGKGKPTKPPTTTYLGARDVIVIAFNFAIEPVSPFTTDEIRAAGFTGPGSVGAYYKETSFGQTTLKGKNDGNPTADEDGLPGDVTQWFTINESITACNYSQWATAAQAAAKDAGWDLTGYEHIVHLFPPQATCNWSGLASVGGTNSWLNGTIAIGTFAHELGHNVTLYHARTLSCTNGEVGVAVGSSCTFEEYGDPFDVMGTSTNKRHFNTRNKGHLGWFPTANVATATSGQTYTLFPLEKPATGFQLLRIPRGREYLYVEARTPFGFDSFAPTDDVVRGALIHSGPDISANGNSYLLDSAPVTPSFVDAALQPGEGFVDTLNGVYIETISVNADGSVTVLVKTGVTNAAPTITAGPTQPMLPGIPHQTNSATAADANKNLSSYRWDWVSCPTACPPMAASGSLSGGSASVPGPLYTPTTAGTYRLALTVWDTAGAKTTITVEERAGV